MQIVTDQAADISPRQPEGVEHVKPSKTCELLLATPGISSYFLHFFYCERLSTAVNY